MIENYIVPIIFIPLLIISVYQGGFPDFIALFFGWGLMFFSLPFLFMVTILFMGGVATWYGYLIVLFSSTILVYIGANFTFLLGKGLLSFRKKNEFQ